MNLRQKYLYSSKRYFNIGVYITRLCRDDNGRIVYVSAEELPDVGFAIEDNSILLPFGYEPHRDRFLPPSNNDSWDTDANRKFVYINREQPPVCTWIGGTPHLGNRLAGKLIGIQYIDIFNDEIVLWSPFSYKKEYRLVH
jgi:hypothetical protein